MSSPLRAPVKRQLGTAIILQPPARPNSLVSGITRQLSVQDGCWLIVFVTKSCPFCKRLGVLQADLQEALHLGAPALGANCTVATVDDAALTTVFRVSAVPTAVLVTSGCERILSGVELTVKSIYRTLQQHLQAASAHCPSPLPSPLSAIGHATALFVAAAVNSADLFDYITQRAALSHTQGFVCLAALAVIMGCVVGFFMAQSHSGNQQSSDELQQQQQQQQQNQDPDADHANSRSSLSSEQQKQVLQGLASLLATALQTKQQQLKQHDEAFQPAAGGSAAVLSSSSSSSSSSCVADAGEIGGSSSDAADAAGLRQRRSTRGQRSSQ